MGKDKVVQIMEQLTEEKNREVTIQLAELRNKQKKYNGITEGELFKLASYFNNKENDSTNNTCM